MPTPTMTPEQRAEALKKAAAARAKRAQLKADLKEGRLTIADVLESDDPVAKKTKVKDVVSALPGFGKVRVESILRQAGVMENRRVGGLGRKQREKIIELAS